MGFFDNLKNTVTSIPGEIKDTFLGSDSPPPTPTTAADAQKLIDTMIGREPDDRAIVDTITGLGMVGEAISLMDEALGGGFTGGPFDPVTRAKIATNNFGKLPDPYMVADLQMKEWLTADPRRAVLYMREKDPLNPELLAYAVEANMQHHDGLLSKAKDTFGDLLGRPIGNTLNMLAWPAAHVETWYGTNFVWNDIGDASLRHTMAKYSYESQLNLFDWDKTWERKARAEAYRIEQSGLKGGAASAAFTNWVTTPDGHLKTSAYVADAIGQIIYDPLWLMPTSWIGKAVTAPIKAATGAQDLGKLGRLATAFGRSYAGEHSLKELTTLSEVTYRTGLLSSPMSRGAALWLTERSPNWAAEASRNKIASLVSGPMLEAATPFDRLQILNKLDQTLRSGIVDEEAARLFGKDVLEDVVLSEAHFHFSAAATKDKKSMTMFDGILEGATKNPEYLQIMDPAVQTKLFLDHALTNAGAIIRDGQQALYPAFISKRYLPIIAAQKGVMGIFTLARPGFIALNFANNLFTYMWHAAGHPLDGASIFGKSAMAEAGTLFKGGGAAPEEFKMLAKMAGIDPVTVERTVVGNVSHHDILGQALGKGFRMDAADINVESAIKAAHKVVAQPLKDMSPRRFRDMVAWPVVVAGRIDRMTRRAAFYHSLKEQMLLGASPERMLLRLAGRGAGTSAEARLGELATRQLEAAPAEFKGGLIPDVHGQLVKAGIPDVDARRMEGHMVDAMRDYLMKGGSLHESKGLTKAWLSGVTNAVGTDAIAHLSPYDLGMQFANSLGHSDEASMVWLRDLQPSMQRLKDEVFPFIGKVPIEQVNAKIDKIADDYHTFDRIQADMTHTKPIPRPGNDYSKGVSLTDDGLKADLSDQLNHMQRYLDTKLPGWEGNKDMVRRIMGAAGDFSTGRITKLYDIHAQKINALANPETAKGFDQRALWQDYFNYVDDSQARLYNTVRDEISKIDTTQLKPIDDWYQNLLKTQKKHRDIIAGAINTDTADAWAEAGKKVGALYRKNALDRSTIFGWQPNEEMQNLGHIRPSMALTRQTEEFMQFVKGKIGPAMVNPVPLHASAKAILSEMSQEMTQRGPDVARILVGHARAKTDFMMLQYSQQYGMDHLLQGIFPYEFFPTRTAMNWGIRIMRQPGAGAMLAKALLLPNEYQKQYGLPDRLSYRIPVPMPFLDEFLGMIPGVGDKLGQGQFSNIYWMDPMSILFPMASFRNGYADEQKRSTPMGIVADWTEKNTPLSTSPFAKIVGGFTGALDKDAWTNSLFNGGPFGIPSSAYGQAAGKWLQTGEADPKYLPPGEQESYVDKGYFSNNWLAQMFGIGEGRFDTFQTERAATSLLASGDLTSEEAWEAVTTHKGAAWEKATKAKGAESFLSNFTGWLGFRVTGSLKGEQIRIGEKVLYEKAAAEGKLGEFYELYPEFELQKVASAGISDPKVRAQLVDNHNYYLDLDKLVSQPYQKALDEINLQIDGIRHQPKMTEIDAERIKHLNDEVQQIRAEQQTIRDMLDRAYPNRDKELSLIAPPQTRQLEIVARDYYNIKQDPSETYEDFVARQSRFLDTFPPKTDQTHPLDWQQLFSAFLASDATFNLKINAAADRGDFAAVNKLRTDRDKLFTQMNNIAKDRLTRDDVEQYLANTTRRKGIAELEFDQASALFDQWMALVGDGSPLTSKQKAAVSAYFRTQPLLRTHYNAATIDLRSLNMQQLQALARRREIKAHYNNLRTNAAKVDYMQAVRNEYDAANAILGLPPVSVLDYRPAPPDLHARTAADAGTDFQGNNLADLLTADPLSDPTSSNVAASEGGLSGYDISQYVTPVTQRGY